MSRIGLSIVRPLVLALVAGNIGSSFAQDNEGPCGNPFHNHFGPFDYRKEHGPNKGMVERAHFPIGVETLTKPSKTTFGMMAQDVGYTLRVFPNHHRALVTMTRLEDRHKAEEPPGARYTVRCYFERAVRYAPDDTVARMLFVQYLGKKGLKDLARQHTQVAIGHADDSAISHFNIGLVAFDLGFYDIAVTQAKKVASLGDTRKDLEDRLRSANQWPANEATASSAASAPQ